MSYLLETRKQRTPQWNRARRHNNVPSGVCVIHTAEGNGAHNVLNWILTRPDYGSYHRLIDATSTLKLAPWSAETFHCRFTNPHSVGISAAVFAKDWEKLGGTGRTIIDRMAIEAADFVTYMKGRGVTVPIRRISRAEALAKKPGFLAHGDTDPGRRTDPGAGFDWDYFFDRARHHLGQPATATASGTATPPSVAKLTLSKKGEPYYARVVDGVPGPYTYAALQQFLADRKYYDRVIDGQAGSYTWKGLQQFLADRGLYDRVIDGRPGHYTWTGVQKFLQKNGWYKRVIDGQPGYYTYRAMQDYLARRTKK